jgi:hypothetical protein
MHGVELMIKNLINQFNESLEDYSRVSEQTDLYFFNQDNSRLEIIKDSVMKYFVYEISTIRNLQYDTDKIVKVIFI